VLSHQGIAAPPSTEAAERMEMRIECADAHSGALQRAFQRAVNARAHATRCSGRGQEVARIVVHDSSGELRDMTCCSPACC